MRRRQIVLPVIGFLSAIGVIGVSLLLASGSADFDDNYVVDFNDLSMWTNYWLYDYNDNRRCESWDLDDNNQIDIYDLDAIADSWLDDYDFTDFASFAPYWNRVVDYRYLDTRFDLAETGLVDFGDFSAFSSQWQITTSCCDDTQIPDPTNIRNWQEVTFYGIDGCPEIPGYCEYDEGYGMWDNCSNVVFVTCDVG